MEVALFIKETRNQRSLTSLFNDLTTESKTEISQKVITKIQ